MNASLTLVDLAGTVALLIWGVHMVQTGIMRAFGPQLRRVLGRALHNRIQALGAGLGITAVLQSSTATGLIVSSFAAGGAIDLVPALAVMLGANVGTTLIVQLLSFDVSRLSPVLVLIGVVMFRRGRATRTRDLGRVAIGIGLMLISLVHLTRLVAPYETAPDLRAVLGALAGDPIIDLLFAAVLTWAAHSSVAIVLLIMGLAGQGVIPPVAAGALVLGANLGSAINPLFESGTSTDPAGRRVPAGNLINRAIGCLIALPLLPWVMPQLLAIDPDAARAVANFHTVFNLVIALLFLPLLGPFARLLARLMPVQADGDDPSRPIYLDQSAHETPSIALAAAAREAMRMADVFADMLRGAVDSLERNDRKRVSETKRMDDVLDRLDRAIKEYVTALDPEALDESDQARMAEILAFSTNLEHAGDILEKSLMPLAAKRIKQGIAFSDASRAEIRLMIERLIANAHAAAAVFMTDDPRAARRLLAEKEVFRDYESRATDALFGRPRPERAEAVEAGRLRLDIIRDLKRVNAHLAAAAYPVLQNRGELLPSRLRQPG